MKRDIIPVYVDQKNKVLQISRTQPTENIRINFPLPADSDIGQL